MPTTILTHGRVTWTNIVRPDAEDIRQLAARYPQLHPLNLQDCLTDREFPKLVLPFSQNRIVFAAVVGLGLAVTGIVAWYLRKGRWL